MAEFFAIDTKQHGLNGAIAGLLGDLLEKGGLDAVLVPCKVPYRKDERIVMQTLVTDRKWLDHVDPFAPVATVQRCQAAVFPDLSRSRGRSWPRWSARARSAPSSSWSS